MLFIKYKLMQNNNDFWITNPSVLFTRYNYYQIIPNSSMTRNEIFNTITRLAIYIAILILIFSKNNQYIFIPIIVIIAIIVLYYISGSTSNLSYNNANTCVKTRENMSATTNKYTIPTPNNPLMNLTMQRIIDNTDKPPASDNSNNMITQNLNKYLNNIGDGKSFKRNFYKTPSTTIVKNNDYARWLYQLPETCKENQNKCVAYEDIRYIKSDSDSIQSTSNFN